MDHQYTAWDQFRDILYVIWPIIALAIIAAIFVGLMLYRQHKRFKKAVTKAIVRDIHEDMAANPTMARSRSGMALSYAQTMFRGVFELENGAIVELRIRENLAETLVPGMRGQLTYKGPEVLSFDVEKP